ncbi:sensor histidine kinase [Nonomuraea jiangxiensis]|uniref:histidine kinase n=1 Tax=Nonomuraea jiangxiensis TaxID=633440 RepID=A0A1G8EPD3_9ACTN|nr:HAMP domain-containing sensor histidine kinase [Nonomuraea jiangxiensis]SDH71687.1 Signal transduction histidine kinase [Nonomuraea jiangxiensis]
MIRYPRSIRGRSTIATSLLALAILAVLAVTGCLAIRYTLGEHVYAQAEHEAGEWTTVARTTSPGALRNPLPVSAEINLVQIVGPGGAVLAASPDAHGLPALSRVRPAPQDPVRRVSDGRHMIVAIRSGPAPDAPVVLAGLAVPALLRGHNLEYLLGALTLLLTACAGAITWAAIGRALRPVEAVRVHMAQITLNDLSRRLPIPPGEDEIADLVRTANHTLARLDEAVARQRRFAATTSHELRNPIAGLRAQLEDALDHPEDNDPRQTLRTALNTTDRLNAIIGDLLAQARLSADSPHELVNLNELIAQETSRTNDSHTHDGSHGHDGSRPGVPVRFRAEGDVWVCGSRIQLIRALANLVGNARRHASSGVEVALSTAGGQAVVSITDDGPGIAPGDRQRVFERYTRLDDGRRLDSGGSGLGLAITRDIAASHRGTLTIEDSPKGARFVLRIPQLDPHDDDGSDHDPDLARTTEEVRT